MGPRSLTGWSVCMPEKIFPFVTAQGHPQRLQQSSPAWQTLLAVARRRLSAANTPKKERVCVLGSGSWGTTVGKIIASNVHRVAGFDRDVSLWTRDETVDGRLLCDVINTTHTNPRFLPGITLPSNLKGVVSLEETVQDATVIVLGVPGQYITPALKQLKEVGLPPSARFISLIKGVHGGREVHLVGDSVRELFGPQTSYSVLMGANIALEVAKERFCEATVGCEDGAVGRMYTNLLETPYFHVHVVKDTVGVELCGTLKNVVALGAGFVDALGYGDNTKAAIIRIGLREMIRFGLLLFPRRGIDAGTFFESCGVADLITTCSGGRNRKVAEAFARTKKPWEQLETELLAGQKLQGTYTATEVHAMLKKNNLLHRFPLFTAIHAIAFEGAPVESIVQIEKQDEDSDPPHMPIA